MTSELIGRTGVVTLGIGGGESLGEVELAMALGTERFLARCATPVATDETVLVVGVSPGRIVDVEPWVAMPT
ncbi:hypothetical protein Gbro_0502 [Gordonia bronchialis DSM 43247]|uniref:Uncharacterized protein n=1 Tax=Gordonia bronchialis (strain ATCC 25592 / DSM 43247 / BCRC 13721 / JCM 3198 / KCTC 3076 / NBRC 16047 / NCTC 10667) TaxID=526226 RepID=D0LEB4_GORB4|nr:hypothetical protein [Gordonia bronchialis]ACY19832.1 hypothetical protein Gbro_0502 [Gordonia bronchialis DSM 43247]MCC3322606.1 hypothetical protein [Gordonia bronchialis]QGS26292.1 hypothetical protein FOB84_21310 [Gordonia bronchialis]UAK37360.1 hypothetical protein K8O93_19845 [Gordonia bronchialis]STQ62610.1 Uncharacterised protein [Gordonia bronchialis]